jgi:hypothetical protein
MFWTAFVATYLFGSRIGALVGVFVPVLNVLLTGLPDVARLGSSVAELVVFAVVAAALVSRFPRLIVAAPLAYVVAKPASAALLAALRSDASGLAPATLGASLDAGIGRLSRAAGNQPRPHSPPRQVVDWQLNRHRWGGWG